MKDLTRKLFLPVLVAGSLILPQKLSAQTQSEQKFPQTHFSLGVDAYRDTDEDVNERYGMIPGARVALSTDFSENKRMEAGFSFFRKSGDIEGFGGKSTLGIYISDFSLSYVSPQGPNENWAVYGGAGVAYVYASETGEIGNFRETIEGNGLGLKLAGGAEFARKEKARFYIQVSALPAISGDLSGLKMTFLEAGIRF